MLLRGMPEVWAALGIRASPSIGPDRFPALMFEAMASGKPVMAAAQGGPTRMVLDGKTGLLVPMVCDGATTV